MTEAIDTVMSPEERIKFDKRFTTGSVNLKGLAEAQAEISFKAGEEYALSKEGHEAISYLEGHQAGEKQGYDKGYTEARNHCEDILLPQERLEGRKEVVEWIEQHDIWIQSSEFNAFTGELTETADLLSCDKGWQAFKKKLGL